MKEIKEENFKVSLPLQVRFSDIDALGHINNNVYFSYFDLGKVDYFQRVQSKSIDWLEGVIVLAHLEIDYFSPIYYKEPIVVESKIIKIGNKSGTFLQQIRNISTNEVKCRCQSVFVTYNPNTQSSMPIPDTWREAISEYEGYAYIPA